MFIDLVEELLHAHGQRMATYEPATRDRYAGSTIVRIEPDRFSPLRVVSASPPVDRREALAIAALVQAHNERLMAHDADTDCAFCGRRGRDALCEIHRTELRFPEITTPAARRQKRSVA